MKEGCGKDFIYGETVIINENGNTRNWHKKTPAIESISANSFKNGMVICHQSMILKKAIAKTFDTQWNVSGDIDWAIRSLKDAHSFYFYDQPVCWYLDGGVSEDYRWQSVKERFKLSVKHFGFIPTIIEQFKIGLQLIKRGRIS